MKSMLPMFGNNKTLVSPTKAWLCKYVVSDFILDSHIKFQLFFGSLDFFVTYSSRKKVNERLSKSTYNQYFIENVAEKQDPSVQCIHRF